MRDVVIRRLRALGRRSRRDERGFFLVFLAVLLVTILALAGFAVDFWHWNHEGSRMQKAADAAALQLARARVSVAKISAGDDLSAVLSSAMARAAVHG